MDARRLALRHTELRQGLSAGLWRLHLLAGAADPEAAARVAGLLCASADTTGLPYALTPSGCRAATLPDLLDAEPGDPAPARTDPAATFPVCGSTALLAALAQVPETEVPGVRLVLRPDFDVTVEQAAAPEVPRRPRFAWALCWIATAARPGLSHPGDVAEPAHVRVRGDRRRKVADRTGLLEAA